MAKIRLEVEMDIRPYSREELENLGIDPDAYLPDDEENQLLGYPSATDVGKCIEDLLNNQGFLEDAFSGAGIPVVVSNATVSSSDIDG